MNQQKISIRFFNDREVRAVWDEENSKWWFSVLDIVSVLAGQDDYTKTRNYWKYLKAKLKKENSELVSLTNQLKLCKRHGLESVSYLFEGQFDPLFSRTLRYARKSEHSGCGFRFPLGAQVPEFPPKL
jgi:cell filamentation protein